MTWQNPEQLGFAASRVEELFVAQELRKAIKLKCCGIKEIYRIMKQLKNLSIFMLVALKLK